MHDQDRIPSLDLLGDRLESAAARSIASERPAPATGARRPSAPFGGRWLLVPALAVVVILALFATVVLTDGSNTADTASAEVIGAMKRSSEIGTGRFHLVADVDTGRGPTRIEADGAYDVHAGRFTETIDAGALLSQLTAVPIPSVGGDAKARVLVDNGTTYVQLPPALSGGSGPAKWFRLGGSSGGANTAAVDPSGVLDLFGGVENVQAVGGDVIDNGVATHYRGEIDLARAYRDLSPADQGKIADSLGVIGGDLPKTGRVPIDVWVDSTGMVRRLSSSVSLSEVPALGRGGQAASTRFTVDFSQVGAPVDIRVPDASEVSDLPSLSGLLGGLGVGTPGTTR